jgi:hypothetical protein
VLVLRAAVVSARDWLKVAGAVLAVALLGAFMAWP